MKSCPALTGLAIVSLMSCGRRPDAFARAQTAAELRSAVLAVVPIGATADSGRRILERARFVCELATNATFGTGERLNYVHCDRSTEADVSVGRRSQVALILTGGHISEVRASTGLIGP
jgi:hypothetical protein